MLRICSAHWTVCSPFPICSGACGGVRRNRSHSVKEHVTPWRQTFDLGVHSLPDTVCFTKYAWAPEGSRRVHQQCAVQFRER